MNLGKNIYHFYSSFPVKNDIKCMEGIKEKLVSSQGVILHKKND